MEDLILTRFLYTRDGNVSENNRRINCNVNTELTDFTQRNTYYTSKHEMFFVPIKTIPTWNYSLFRRGSYSEPFLWSFVERFEFVKLILKYLFIPDLSWIYPDFQYVFLCFI